MGPLVYAHLPDGRNMNRAEGEGGSKSGWSSVTSCSLRPPRFSRQVGGIPQGGLLMISGLTNSCCVGSECQGLPLTGLHIDSGVL